MFKEGREVKDSKSASQQVQPVEAEERCLRGARIWKEVAAQTKRRLQDAFNMGIWIWMQGLDKVESSKRPGFGFGFGCIGASSSGFIGIVGVKEHGNVRWG